MKKLMLACTLFLLTALSPAFAQVVSAEIVGKYNIVKGVNPDGSEYDGQVTIKPDASGGVTIVWDDGSIGLGMIEGNRLYVGMVYEKRSVVMSMTINKDGSINGKWIQRTEAGTGIENWKKR